MGMNNQIREAARRELNGRGWTQQQLAGKARVRQATISRLLAGERTGEPATWERLLSALELELIAVPKGTNLENLAEKGR